METKYCKNCKHYEQSEYGYTQDRCTANVKPEFVRGSMPIQTCHAMRVFTHKCGPEAKWFEPATETA